MLDSRLLGTPSAYIFWLFGGSEETSRLTILQGHSLATSDPQQTSCQPPDQAIWPHHLFLGLLPRMLSVCALLLHARYLFPHTRLPTRIIVCTHAWLSRTSISAYPSFVRLKQRDSNPLRLVPNNREDATPLAGIRTPDLSFRRTYDA
jgi:hypothetical protein